MAPWRNIQASRQTTKSNLPYITELTDRLSPNPTRHEYEFKDGRAIINGLLKIPQVAVATVNLYGGAEFPRHRHDCSEFVIVYEGEVVIGCGEENHHLKVGDIFKIDRGVGHTCCSLGDSSIVVITVPADTGYPSGDHHA